MSIPLHLFDIRERRKRRTIFSNCSGDEIKTSQLNAASTINLTLALKLSKRIPLLLILLTSALL